ncbi:hypothetical protein KKH56_01590 [bacterium]|nr:hypothetical protein [bacterium]
MIINGSDKEGLAFLAINDKLVLDSDRGMGAVAKKGNPEVIDVRLLKLFTRCRSRFFLDEMIVGNKFARG